MPAIAESLWPVPRAVRALRSNGPDQPERIGTRQRTRAAGPSLAAWAPASFLLPP
jgi:hypothetical protein